MAVAERLDRPTKSGGGRTAASRDSGPRRVSDRGGQARRLEPQRQQVLRLPEPGGVARPGGEDQADGDFLHDRMDRFEGQRGVAVQAFALQERVGKGAHDDVVCQPAYMRPSKWSRPSSVFSCWYCCSIGQR